MSTVYEAWSAVMGAVQGIGKNERVTEGPARFSFRGVDTVTNAVGPALRTHGVSVIPRAKSVELERYATAKGSQMLAAVVHMEYTVFGPEGDSFTGASYGQSADSGDKAVSKAQSVAFRMFLLQSLTIPTDEPDPDLEVHQRVDPVQQATDDLMDALDKAGIPAGEFAAWSLSPAGGGLNLRECRDPARFAALAARVRAEGKAMMGGEQ